MLRAILNGTTMINPLDGLYTYSTALLGCAKAPPYIRPQPDARHEMLPSLGSNERLTICGMEELGERLCTHETFCHRL